MKPNPKNIIEQFNKELLGFNQHALLKSMGFNSKEIRKKRIAIVNSWSEQSPAHIHLRDLSKALRDGIIAAGGMPFEINVIGPCGSFGHDADEIAHFDLPTREVILTSIEAALRTGYCDGWVGLGSCDKIVPAMLLAAIRLNRPCIIIPGGTMIPGIYKKDWVTIGKGANLYFKEMLEGKVTTEYFEEMTSACGPCQGTCSELTTGSTMQVISEVLGMSLPYSSTTPAVMSQIKILSKDAGEKIMEMANTGVRPLDIITEDSIKNAIRVVMAISGSTNSIVHIQSFAHEAKLDITLDTWDEISKKILPICPISPSGPYSVYDLHLAGGIPAVMRELESVLALNCPTVSGKTVKENIKGAEVLNREVIRKVDNPVFKHSSIRILRGNLAPRGAVVRQSVITDDSLFNYEFKAKVYNSYSEALNAVLNGEVKSGDGIVLRYEGPRGGPAMAELYFVVYAIKKMGLKKIAIITDGRFSGFTQGMLAIGHVCPEAYVGGPLAIVENGDTIHVDLTDGRIDLKISEKDIIERTKEWSQPEKEHYEGVLAVFRKLALQADEGAGWQLK